MSENSHLPCLNVHRFTKEYFAEPRRGYGGNVPVVFGALRKSDFEQPFLPAREQFNGKGSFGNGGGSTHQDNILTMVDTLMFVSRCGR